MKNKKEIAKTIINNFWECQSIMKDIIYSDLYKIVENTDGKEIELENSISRVAIGDGEAEITKVAIVDDYLYVYDYHDEQFNMWDIDNISDWVTLFDEVKTV